MRFFNSFKTKIMDLLPVELNKIRRTAATTFAGKDDFGLLAEWRGQLGDDQNPYRRDAVDFAELTIHRFAAHSAIRSRLFPFHCLHHGCAVVLDRKEVVLGSLGARRLPISQYDLSVVTPSAGKTAATILFNSMEESVISDWIRLIRMVNAVKLIAILLLAGGDVTALRAQSSVEEHALQITVNPADGKYTIAMPKSDSYALRAGVGAEVDGRWLHASDYLQHSVERSHAQGYLGDATDWKITYSGLTRQPDLIYHLRAYSSKPFGDIQVTVQNTTGKTIHVESIRAVEATEEPIVDLGGPALDNRILSDSFSEDRPAITIRNFADGQKQMHRAVGSQLIYNRRSHESLFLGALTSDRFLTILRLHLVGAPGTQPVLPPTRSIRLGPPRWRRKILWSILH